MSQLCNKAAMQRTPGANDVLVQKLINKRSGTQS